jgi:formate hydrogenlyase subunit 3/multisubunit Na+/H+ antiporter MnhD subunit
MTSLASLLQTAAWPAVPLLPVALCAALGLRTLRGGAEALAPWAALPALALLGLADGAGTPGSDAILLGSRLALDSVGRAFLLLTVALWTAAGVYARTYLAGDPLRRRFLAFHLLALSGNLGLVLAADGVTFYLFFSLMTFAAYGLVVHDATPAARRAGRAYIALAVVGESLMLAALVVGFRAAGAFDFGALGSLGTAPTRDLYVGLALFGLGVKAGLVPLHVWLPLAHPVAPTPASAVLSGAMIKAGLLGWIRFLPAGAAALPAWGDVCVALGLLAALGAAVVGTAQRDPKTILAYSSISQMGWLTAGLGAALSAPAAAGPAVAAVALFAAHHGLAKGALFLGVGIAPHAQSGMRRRLWLAGLGLGALALAGAPWTSGALAKGALKAAGYEAGWSGSVSTGWTFAALLTAVLLARFLVSVASVRGDFTSRGPPGLWLPWLGLTGFALLIPAAAALGLTTLPPRGSESLIDTVGPPLMMAAAVAAFMRRQPTLEVPPGDLIVVFGALERWTASAIGTAEHGFGRVSGRVGAARASIARWIRSTTLHERVEDALEPWLAIGVTVLALGAAMTLLLLVA